MTDSSFDDPSSVNAHDQFHNAYGAAMTAWARLEGVLFYWFMDATGFNEPIARAIFFSARNFTGRRDMLRASLPFARFDDAGMAVIKAGLGKARKWSEFRNKIAHGEPVLDIRQQSASWGQFVLAEGKSIEESDPVVTVHDLNIATRNFDELRRLLWDAHPMYRTPTLDAGQYLRLIRELPNQGHSSERSRIPEDT
jgi:hypothetical protein